MITKKKRETLFWHDSDTISTLISSLSSGEISVVSTDTILGFLASLSSENCFNLNMIKGRDSDKNYLIVCESMSKVEKFIQKESLSDNALNLLSQCWPGEVTAIFKANGSLPGFLVSQGKTIAIRCPKHQGLRSVLQHFDGLFSTSANRAGMPFAKTVDELDDALLSEIAYIVLNSEKQAGDQKPSTIIDLSDEKERGEIKVVREGSCSITQLARWYSGKICK